MDNENTAIKYTQFTREQIDEYLCVFKELINKGMYTISRNSNRLENDNFIKNYRIDGKKEKEILMSIQYTDFCYAVGNRKKDFEDERLYVFCKNVALDNWGTEELVEIYIKTNIVQRKGGQNFAIVISFHKKNKGITYLFR